MPLMPSGHFPLNSESNETKPIKMRFVNALFTEQFVPYQGEPKSLADV